MDERHRDLLQKALEKNLSDSERDTLNKLLDSNSELRAELMKHQNLEMLLKDIRSESFKPFFTTRVMRKVKAETSPENVFTEALSHLFRKVAIASAALIIAVTAYNVTSQWHERNDRNLIELAFNLTPANLETSIESNLEVL
ncbi:hypothetical protein CEE37_14145 [candidate division LCP-89 bacterium B3_LCP]|uniref:Uncharacterized protein n=1 Tax=candidate division LCP-89 bacterium B3_LCP TaxID=2012998 RepID=A0A532UQM8_UNCL8|nr:MAG: hypothetical protein CEE37_14145 [candidate division LCP-89 bacterium B3_LCP]